MKKSDITLLIMLFITIVTIILLKCFSIKTEGVLIKYAKNQTNSAINKIIDSTVRKILIDEKFNNIIEIEKNESKQITNVNFNNNKINKILTISTNNILREIEKDRNKVYEIPFGIMINNHIFHNLGPKIPYIIDTMGMINTNTYVNIKEYGINNSMIEVILDIEIEYQIMLAFVKETQKIKKSIILENKVIQGSIPEYYGNVNSLLK